MFLVNRNSIYRGNYLPGMGPSTVILVILDYPLVYVTEYLCLYLST